MGERSLASLGISARGSDAAQPPQPSAEWNYCELRIDPGLTLRLRSGQANYPGYEVASLRDSVKSRRGLQYPVILGDSIPTLRKSEGWGTHIRVVRDTKVGQPPSEPAAEILSAVEGAPEGTSVPGTLAQEFSGVPSGLP